MSTVNQKMTAIADNIRSFTGTTEPLTLDDMADGINEVNKAGQKSEYDRFWDNYQQNGKRTNYGYSFCGMGWNKENFKPKYTPIIPTGVYAVSMFQQFDRGKETTKERVNITPEIVDFSNCTSAGSTFMDSNFNSVIADFSNVTSLNSTFSMGDGTSNGIRSIKIKVTDKCTTFAATFIHNNNLEEMIFTEDSVIGANISFAHSNKLTHESLMSIINALKDYSGTTTTRTLTLHATSKALLTDTEKAMATHKGWTIA